MENIEHLKLVIRQSMQDQGDYKILERPNIKNDRRPGGIVQNILDQEDPEKIKQLFNILKGSALVMHSSNEALGLYWSKVVTNIEIYVGWPEKY